MKVTIGPKGCEKTHQDTFPERVQCIHCGSTALIAFVAHEGFDKDDKLEITKLRLVDQNNAGTSIGNIGAVCYLGLKEPYSNGESWLHDWASFATYVCSDCLKATTIFNQA